MNRFGLLSLFVMLAAATGCNGSSSVASAPPTTQPAHAIRHIVILLQENRSFNNLFMGFPGADTATTGKCKGSRYCPKSGIVPIRLGDAGKHGHAQSRAGYQPQPCCVRGRVRSRLFKCLSDGRVRVDEAQRGPVRTRLRSSIRIAPSSAPRPRHTGISRVSMQSPIRCFSPRRPAASSRIKRSSPARPGSTPTRP